MPAFPFCQTQFHQSDRDRRQEESRRVRGQADDEIESVTRGRRADEQNRHTEMDGEGDDRRPKWPVLHDDVWEWRDAIFGQFLDDASYSRHIIPDQLLPQFL